MPSEKFYNSDRIEGDELPPDLTVTWPGRHRDQGTGQYVDDGLPCAVQVNGIEYDRSGLNRLITSLRRARNQVFGIDA
ncbi:hypothetical protein JTF08_13660 [Micrococcaceae bacterium RIT802]|nr:hypothetical protein [Micrococcaceae bacterium RIT 802]